MPTSPRERARDACPGVLRTHPAADGALARLRLPGGGLSPVAARELAACAREVADGHVELTSRGNVQLRGLAEGGAAVLARRARAVGLLPSDTHERVRNIIASPLSGRRGAGRDIEPLVAALDHGLCADPALADLPGRILFAIDDGSGDLAGLAADLTLRAQPAGRTLLLVAGEPRALLVPDDAAVPALLAAARAFVDLRRAGEAAAADAWRVAELPAGRERLLAAAARVAPPGVWADAGRGGAWEPGGGEGTVAVAARPGVYAQRDGRCALTVLVALGRLRADQLDLLAEIAARAGECPVLVTPWRSVVLRDIAPAAAAGIVRQVAGAGLAVAADSGWIGVTSCAGRPGCARALADVRRDAARAAGGPAGGPGRGALPVHWSGCARRCGQPAGGIVEVVAEPGGYRVRRAEGLAPPGDVDAALSWAPGAAGELPVGGWERLLGAVTSARGAG